MEKGLFFVPTPREGDKHCLQRDLYEYHRRLKLLHHFGYSTSPNREHFVEPTRWEPEWNLVPEALQGLIKSDLRGLERINRNNRERDNLSAEERRALNQLQKNQDIVIKPADKGSKIVIMDKTQYLIEANRQLNNPAHYRLIPGSLQSQTRDNIRKIVRELYEKKYISAKQKNYLFGQDPYRPRRFYLLPKIHKDPNTWTVPYEIPPGRPIVSDCGSESCRSAEYIDHFLNPLSQKHSSYIKDTYEFVNKINTIDIPPGAMLFSIDIDALYTNIDTHLGLKAVRQIFNQYPDPTRPDEALLSLLELNLTQNDFEFDSRCYLQIHGTAMGKKFAPAYANIYMADWEQTVLPKCPNTPLLYIRYLDDIFGVWTHSETDFKNFINILNKHHNSIYVKYNLQHNNIEFLDTQVFVIKDNSDKWTLGTRVYFKPTDTHALLHKDSFHPKHTFKGIVKSQIIRFMRICTNQQDVETAISELFKVLRTRGYSRTFLRTIKTETQKHFSTKKETNKEIQGGGLIPLVTTFSSNSLKLNSKVKTNFAKTQKVIEPLSEFKIISAFKRNKNLKDLLVHASLEKNKNPPEQKYLRPIKFIKNKYTDLSAPIWQDLGLDSLNVVYLIMCKTCHKLYVGQTKNRLKQRLKQHLYNIGHENINKTTHLYLHFRTHGPENLLISGLESVATWSTAQRLAAEKRWIKKLNTKIPTGLNEI